MKLVVLHQSRLSRARVCQVTLPSGRSFLTPSFVPVGTNTLLKAVPPHHVTPQLVPGLIFLNTYHMMVQPGLEVIRKAKGLHNFFGCPDRPLISDSGGFQVFSLHRKGQPQDQEEAEKTESSSDLKELKGASKRRFDSHPSLRGAVTEEGVKFRSYRDGTLFHLTPETSVEAQQTLGADIILPLDELLPLSVSEKRLMRSFERTHRWQMRSLQKHFLPSFSSPPQTMYGIVHGGLNVELRKQSVHLLLQMQAKEEGEKSEKGSKKNSPSFGGLAIGGSLGRTIDDVVSVLDAVIPSCPDSLPRHLLGIGDPHSVSPIIQCGIDTFDSAYPTRSARHGHMFVWSHEKEHGEEKNLFFGGKKMISLKVSSPKMRFHSEPVCPGCECASCASGNMRGDLLHHLSKTHDTSLGSMLTIHNVHMMNTLCIHLRNKILEGNL